MNKKRKSIMKPVYLGLFFVILYIPIMSIVIYSFNKSPSTAHWTGFTLDWYRSLFQDRVIVESFILSLQVGVMTAILSAIIGTAGAIVSIFVGRSMEKTIDAAMIIPLLVPEVALGISLLMLFTFVP